MLLAYTILTFMVTHQILAAVFDGPAASTVSSAMPSNTSNSSSTVPFIPRITLPPLPPEFSGIPARSLACYDQWASAAAVNAYISGQIHSLASSLTLYNLSRTYTTSHSWSTCEMLPYPGKYATLCDGIARNTETMVNKTCSWTGYTSTISYVDPMVYTSSVPAYLVSWSNEHVVSTPTCTAAPDRQSLCYTLHSAYSWRTSAAKASRSVNTTYIQDYVLEAEKPQCRTLRYEPPANLTTKSCILGVDQYEMHYWPSAPLTGLSLCANVTRQPGGTRTIPWLPNTAIVSGLTLTSPSVYHFLKGAAVSTSIGKTHVGRAYSPVYSLSSSISSQTILTLPQEESNVWTVSPTRLGRGIHAHWEYRFANGSFNADAYTLAAASYFGIRTGVSSRTGAAPTISQASFRQYPAVSIKDVLDEWDGDEFQDCIWHQYWEQGPWYDREDMWIAPGAPSIAIAITTDDGESVAVKSAH